jgi:hypothetical protein
MPTLEIHLHGVTLMSSPMNCFLILSIVACGLLVEGLVTENLTFVNITSDSAIVLWKSPFGDASGSTSSMIIRKIFRKSRIANYTIQSCWTNDSEVLPHSRLGTYYYLTSLQQNTTYCYFSKYTTRNGTVQNYSSCRCFKTDPGAPSKPASFTFTQTTSRAVRVSWSECVGATAYYLGFKSFKRAYLHILWGRMDHREKDGPHLSWAAQQHRTPYKTFSRQLHTHSVSSVRLQVVIVLIELISLLHHQIQVYIHYLL